MTTITALEDLHEAAERLMEARPDLGVWVVPIGEGEPYAASVEVTCQPRTRCRSCGQHLDTRRPGPVDWIDPRTGIVQGGWSFQHSCGHWNLPASARVQLDLADEPDAEAVLTDLAHGVDTVVREDRDDADIATRGQLRDELRAALAELAAGADPDDVTTGSDMEPGVCRDDAGRWIAWDHGAQMRGGDEGADPIIVTEDDVR